VAAAAAQLAFLKKAVFCIDATKNTSTNHILTGYHLLK
jgi:hypothetical protein